MAGRILQARPGTAGRILAGPRPGSSGSERGTAAGGDDRQFRARAGLPVWLLVASLPMFGQVFHYVIDVPPLYYLSKAWPLLTLPLAILGLMRVAAPYRMMYLAALAYTLAVAPAMSMVYLGNLPLDALATTVKAWPLAYYFSLLAALVLLRVPPALLARSFHAYGVATWGLMFVLWVVVPAGFYVTDPAESRLFLFDFERGYRIFMPLFFGMFALFHAAERFCRDRRGRDALLVAVAIVGLLLIFKQRTQTAAALLVLGWILFTRSSGLLRSLLLAAICIGSALFLAMLLGPLGARLLEGLGASLTIRQQALAMALEFLAADPLRWIFGVGSITRFSEVTLFDIFGTEHFYLADIGWAGIVFEYGVVGGLLILGVYLAGLREALRPRPTDGPVLEAALAHLILFLVLVTTIYPPMYAPGEVALATAALVYLRRRRQPDAALGP